MRQTEALNDWSSWGDRFLAERSVFLGLVSAVYTCGPETCLTIACHCSNLKSTSDNFSHCEELQHCTWIFLEALGVRRAQARIHFSVWQRPYREWEFDEWEFDWRVLDDRFCFTESLTLLRSQRSWRSSLKSGSHAYTIKHAIISHLDHVNFAILEHTTTSTDTLAYV